MLSSESASPFRKGIKPGLYAITDSKLTPPDRLITAVEAALRGGVSLVQYREKSLPFPERLTQTRNLRAACANAGVPLIINDDPELAARCGAAGVHLGQTDTALSAARQRLGEEAIIGATCHADITLAEEAMAAGVDYLAFGRFFSSSTKPSAPSATPDVLSEARRFQVPLTAIGGVTVDNGEVLIRSGADLLAVVGDLFAGDDAFIEQQARRFCRLFLAHHPLF